MAELTDETRSELDKLKVEYSDNDSKRAAMTIAGDAPTTPIETTSSQGRELVELRSQVDFGKYVAAAMAGNGVIDGPEREYNQHLGIADNYFPWSSWLASMRNEPSATATPKRLKVPG